MCAQELSLGKKASTDYSAYLHWLMHGAVEVCVCVCVSKDHGDSR